MGMRAEDIYSAFCDHCNESLEDEHGEGGAFMGQTLKEVEEEASRVGWIRVAGDFVCPKCAEKVEEYEHEKKMVEAISLLVANGHIVSADAPAGGPKPTIHANGESGHAIIFDGRDLNDNDSYQMTLAAENYLLWVERLPRGGKRPSKSPSCADPDCPLACKPAP